MAGLPKPGEVFGRYEILRRLGRGGMGVVFAARQEGLGREVALKLLSPELADSEDYRRRFGREAAALARLESAHVITVYDAGEHDGWLYIATQLVPDGDLLSWLHEHGPFAPAVALDLVGQIAAGLADAHAVGILHRDIKPSNVLLRRRLDGSLHAYLCDFGIAMDEGSEHTKTVGVIGTLGYMAPERHRGEPASVSSDVYALGCLLWALLHGSAPYSGTDWAVATAHISEPVPQLGASDPIAVAINQVLRSAMAKDPADRYGSTADLLVALESARAAGTPGSTAETPPVVAPSPLVTAEQTAVRPPPEPGWTEVRPPEVAVPTVVDPQAELVGPALAHTSSGVMPGRARMWLIGALVVVVLGGGAGLWALLGGDGGDDEERTDKPAGVAGKSAPDTTSTPDSDGVTCWDGVQRNRDGCPPASGRVAVKWVFSVPETECSWDTQGYYRCDQEVGSSTTTEVTYDDRGMGQTVSVLVGSKQVKCLPRQSGAWNLRGVDIGSLEVCAVRRVKLDKGLTGPQVFLHAQLTGSSFAVDVKVVSLSHDDSVADLIDAATSRLDLVAVRSLESISRGY